MSEIVVAAETETAVDVAIIGAGAAGATAAGMLAKRGISVALIASHHRHPPEYRAEKIGEAQIAMIDEAGLGAAARSVFTAFDGCWLRRFGHIVERDPKREYGGDYGAVVDAMRGALPAGVAQIVGRVETIETGPDQQFLRLADGRSVRSRLLVMSTGLSEAALKKAGMSRDVYSRHHSLTAGFDLSRPPSDFPFPSLVWAGDGPSDKLAYLTLFPIGNAMRANLFVYRSPFEDWTRELRDDPNRTLNEMMPAFRREYGELAVSGPVMIRPIDLARSSTSSATAWWRWATPS
ncbi:FAD-dependent oxidoreductase [Chenggangzhangella methanolivorans]|uniref:FAD-dependent monooxygenase n=1 Tax=Chenggangzhangella methanolivorans TaxID=1437009 RepID=A0A9E6RD00_9HYPH|nr:FAD-dependent monooxygenase [Chenggangzhangella methanolivorans]QZO01029.1 FAD-dependent monooxygenase [Chenggangzhangella methanolivorans]